MTVEHLSEQEAAVLRRTLGMPGAGGPSTRNVLLAGPTFIDPPWPVVEELIRRGLLRSAPGRAELTRREEDAEYREWVFVFEATLAGAAAAHGASPPEYLDLELSSSRGPAWRKRWHLLELRRMCANPEQLIMQLIREWLLDVRRRGLFNEPHGHG